MDNYINNSCIIIIIMKTVLIILLVGHDMPNAFKVTGKGLAYPARGYCNVS